MAAVIPEEINKHLSCAICQEEFKEPKVLTCLHTYCKECLVKLTVKQGRVITCPECKQHTEIFDGDVNKLQSNFWMNNCLTLQNAQPSSSSGLQSLTCEHCESSNPAVSRCTECYVFMCEFCVTSHRRINATKSHQILTMEEVRRLGSKALVKPAFCNEHSGETLKLFCKTCQKTICRDCTIFDHHGHKYNFVAEVADKERKMIQDVLQKTKTKKKSVEESLRAVQAMQICICYKAAQLNDEVDSFCDNQVRKYEHLRANLKNKLSKEGEGKVTQLKSQMEELSSFVVQLQDSVNFCDQALADGNDVELLSLKKQVVQRLTKLNSSQYQHEPCTKDSDLKLQVLQTVGDTEEMARAPKTSINAVLAECVLSMAGGEKGVWYKTLVGQTVDFLLTLKLEKGATAFERHCCTEIDTTVKYQQYGQKERQEEISLPVSDNGDGSHSFSFLPKDAGIVTLTVKVKGQNIRQSPLQWQVETKTPWPDVIFSSTFCDSDAISKGAKKTKVSHYATSWRGSHVFMEGIQSWKLELFSFRGRNAIEIGVQSRSVLSPPEKARRSWQYDPSKKKCASRSDGQKASMTSVQDSDVFTVFLNLQTKKLIIYNARSKQSESFTDVEGEVVPFYTPSLRYNTGIWHGETCYLDLV